MKSRLYSIAVVTSCCLFTTLWDEAAAQNLEKFVDVRLTSAGVLTGHAYSQSGRPLSQAVVHVKYHGKTIAVAASSPTGEFAVSNVRPGVHEVVLGSQSQGVRCWAPSSAPPGCVDCCRIGAAQQSMHPTPHGHVMHQQPLYVPDVPCSVDDGCTPCGPGTELCCETGLAMDFLPIVATAASVAALVVAIDAKDTADAAVSNVAVASP